MNTKIIAPVIIMVGIASAVLVNYFNKDEVTGQTLGVVTTTPADETDVEVLKVEFGFESAGESSGTPMTLVKLNINNTLHTVGPTQGTCSKQELKEEVPPDETIITAAQCWWAGAGEDFLVTKKEDMLLVKRRLITEEDDQSPPFNPGMVINLATNSIVQ